MWLKVSKKVMKQGRDTDESLYETIDHGKIK